MNIEEAIDNIRKRLEQNNMIFEETGNFLYYRGKEVVKEVQTLLTAYEKEKEITDKLKEMNISVDTLIAEFERLEDLEDDRIILKAELEKEKEKNKEQYKEFIKEHGEVCEKLKEDINKEWKDKIKAKIEELKKIQDIAVDWQKLGLIGSQINILQSLLEEKE